jgi:hypothetical protein
VQTPYFLAVHLHSQTYTLPLLPPKCKENWQTLAPTVTSALSAHPILLNTAQHTITEEKKPFIYRVATLASIHTKTNVVIHILTAQDRQFSRAQKVHP